MSMVLEQLELPEWSSMETHVIARTLSPVFRLWDIANEPTVCEDVALGHLMPLVNDFAWSLQKYLNSIRVSTTAEYRQKFIDLSKALIKNIKNDPLYVAKMERRFELSDDRSIRIQHTVQVIEDIGALYTFEIFQSQSVPSLYLARHTCTLDHTKDTNDDTAWMYYSEYDIVHNDTLDQAEVDAIMASSPKQLLPELLWVIDTYVREQQWC